MMRTLRDMNMSKFVAEDVPLFLSLVDDMFPGLKAERAHFPEVVAALEKVRWAQGGCYFPSPVRCPRSCRAMPHPPCLPLPCPGSFAGGEGPWSAAAPLLDAQGH